ncbi:MAG: leucyl aminopeptidase [Thermodesulfobacteriota bacterium]
MISLTSVAPEDFKGDLLVYFAREKQNESPFCSESRVKAFIDRAFAAGDFKGKKEELLLVYPDKKIDGIKAGRLLVVGLGKEELDRETFRLVGGAVSVKARKLRAERLKIVLPREHGFDDRSMAEALSEGLVLGSYSFRKYKSKDSDPDNDAPEVDIKKISLYASSGLTSLRKAARRGENAAEAGITARDMANEPGNVWTPSCFADFGRDLARERNLYCTVLKKEDLKRIGMGGMLGVSQGSKEEPAVVILEYRSGRKVPVLLLVGKGLTFDSGGISLKPAKDMAKMKFDMCGGAAVMAAMQTIGKERPKNVDVVAIIPAAENMPGGSAIKPGDIITHYGGKSVEVDNTDAEGRLVLADALAYGIEKYKPDAVVDLATLTGAVVIGLGHHYTGLMANDDNLAEKILNAGEKSGESLWRLPLGKEYTRQLKSEVADLKNVGNRAAGTITAGAFLQEFVGETAWAHLDIAGTAFDYTEKSYVPKGPSGIGTRTIIDLVRDWR